MLLLSRASLHDLQMRLLATHGNPESARLQSSIDRFRPNLVVSGALMPFEEDNWHAVAIGKASFQSAGE